ncbi:hypothetical protein BDAP_000056 [Binucleata daphniae]
MESYPVSISEALYELNKKTTQTIKVTDIYNKTKDYLEKFAKINDKHAIDDINRIMADNQFTSHEIAVIGSLLPTQPENIKKLVPTLERISDNIIYKLADLISDHLTT